MDCYMLALFSCIGISVNTLGNCTPKANDNSASVNYVIGDISFIEKFAVNPDKYTDENVRIMTHLEYVENLLRHKDISHLTDQQKEQRGAALELLHQYWLAGRFPKNYDHLNRKPCFEDKEGNLCAVGYLIAKTEGPALVKKINSRHQYDYIKNMTLPEIAVWCDQYGLTLEECAMIQPTYNSEGKPSKGGNIAPAPHKPVPPQENNKKPPVENPYKDQPKYVNTKKYFSVTTKKSAYCVLNEGAYKVIKEAKENSADSIIKIGIKTNCEPGKKGEWDCYRFITPLEISKLTRIGDKTPRLLIINNQPFTGFLKIVKNIDTDINIYVLRFDNGYYETHELINNPYCTLPHYDYVSDPY